MQSKNTLKNKYTLNFNILRSFSLRLHNARLRGWQRITTKPKHNNRNHRGSMGLETPRVDSPS